MELMPKELRAKWAPVVGNFIIEFGHIEIVISEIVRFSSLPTQFETLKDLRFQLRANLAKAALIHWHADSKQAIQSDFGELSAIAKRRNVVAHNGFSVAIYEPEGGGKFFYEFGMSRSYKPDDVLLQIQDLETDTATLTAIHDRLVDWIPASFAANSTREAA
jgi:hypothetical protein